MDKKRALESTKLDDDSSDEEQDPKKLKAAENLKQWKAIEAHMKGNSKPLKNLNDAQAAQKKLEESMGKLGVKGGRTRRYRRGKKFLKTHKKLLKRRK